MLIQVNNNGYILTAVLHTFGLCLLYKVKIILPNQRLLLINIAAAEMFNCWRKVILDGLIVVESTSGLPFLMSVFSATALAFKIRFIVFHISLDRVLDIWLNIKLYLTVTILASSNLSLDRKLRFLKGSDAPVEK